MKITHALGCIALAASLPAQRTWFVDASAGTGHDFTALAPCVAAAAAGDIVVVRAGTYSEPQIDIAKGLVIVGSGQVELVLGSGPTTLAGIVVHDLPADQSFVLRDVALGGSFVPSGSFHAERCAGIVGVERVHGVLGPLGIDVALFLQFVDCAAVHVDGVFVRGGGGVSFTRSRGSMTRSVCEGDIFGAFGTTDSDVTLHSCTLTSGFNTLTFGAPATVSGGTLRVSRSQITARRPLGLPLASIDVTAPATVYLDPTAMLVPANGAAPTSGAATVVSEELTTLRAGATPTALEIDLQGGTGALFVTLMSFPTIAAPTPFGDLWVDAGTHLVVRSGVLSARTDTTAIPVTGVPPGLLVIAQAVVLDSRIRLSNGNAVAFP